MRWKQANELRCSFCHKSQDIVVKLISSPNDYPRAYICDECVTVCNSILEDDRQESHPATTGTPLLVGHPWLTHPMASELFSAIEDWTQQELAGRDTSKELAKVRTTVLLMMAEEQSN